MSPSQHPALILLLLGVGLVCSCASTPQERPLDPAEAVPEQTIAQLESEKSAVLEQDSGEDDSRIDRSSEEQALPDPGVVENPEIENLNTQLAESLERERLLSDELRTLYRRLHIELDTGGRSTLIVELFNDQRADFRLLGFELADRDLSASKELGDLVGQAVRTLLQDNDPVIRSKSARLITRLVPPDGMIVITNALKTERNPIAVEPMLMGIARWPNPDALPAIRSWIGIDDAPLVALCSAAWAMEQEGYLEPLVDHPLLLERLRIADAEQLREDGMKLLAKLGSAEDLRRLISLTLSTDPSVVRWAASALVETPRAVEVLAQAAAENEVLYLAAAESIIKHRATPEGLRRLSELPQSDGTLRNQMIIRMGQAIDRERLGEAVRLSRLKPEIAITILGRLLTSEQEQTPRSAKGVLQLAELQFNAGRPNRVIEAILALEDTTLDPSDEVRRDSLRIQSLILLNRLDDAAAISLDTATWELAIGLVSDPAQRARIARNLLGREGATLSDEQRDRLMAIVEEDQTESPDPEAIED